MSTAAASHLTNTRPPVRFIRLEPIRGGASRRRSRPPQQLTLAGVSMSPTSAGVARVARARAERLEWERVRRARRQRLALERERAQLVVDLPVGVRVGRRERLARIGRDPNPDAPWSSTPLHVRHFADYFPDGMSFAEIGEVLGVRKQQAFKIYVRASRKVAEALAREEQRVREALRQRDAATSNWDVA